MSTTYNPETPRPAGDAPRVGIEGDGHGMKQQGSETLDSAKHQASDLAETAKQRARSYAEQGKERGAEQMGGVARAIRDAANSLEKESPTAARYVRDAADGIDSMSQALNRNSVDDLFGSVADYGRRNPGAVFGGAVMAGFFLARFMKSSGERRHHEMGRHGTAPAYRPPGRVTAPGMRGDTGLGSDSSFHQETSVRGETSVRSETGLRGETGLRNDAGLRSEAGPAGREPGATTTGTPGATTRPGRT